MDKPNISVFFGAGAEIGYGLPSGGKFALEIFRCPNEEDKEVFRHQIQNINRMSQIATQWLPDNYTNKRLNVFGKGEFEGLIASSLENRRNNILAYLDNFDEHVINILQNWHVTEEVVRQKFTNETNEHIGDQLYSQSVRLNEKLAAQVPLFDSAYFSAFFEVISQTPSRTTYKKES
ncbi:hypothetical protein ACT7CU_27240 [Bacillus paranthracis]